MNRMSRPCRASVKPTAEEVSFCRALLNNQCSLTDIPDGLNERRKRFKPPLPEDFVYGIKHPKAEGLSGVAAVLQHDERLDQRHQRVKVRRIPDFIALNKLFSRLRLTKVHDIHQYRKTKPIDHSCKASPINCQPISSDVTFGRVRGEQPSIRDLIEHKYLHQWLETSARRRCKEILNEQCPTQRKKPLIQRKKRTYCH